MENSYVDNFLKEIRHLTLSAGKLRAGGPAGSRRSKERGISLDFHGHREYLPGDDIRRVDWKAYARTGNFYVREFTAERQMHVSIILDNSASMDFGSPNKWRLAQTAALGLGYIALQQGDILSLRAINHRAQTLLDRGRGKDSFPKLLRQIRDLKPAGGTALDALVQPASKGFGMTVLISDLFGAGLPEALDYLCSGGREVAVLHLLSPQETEPGYGEELKLVDKETGETRLVYLDQATRELYREKARQFTANCRNICHRRNVRYVLGGTDTAPVTLVAAAAGLRQ
ncbi:MAG: DUF58 domain-containing protein [Firmicutes bacterium]|nr:DUF58 domain-containing protein [Bacillota bacterium]